MANITLKELKKAIQGRDKDVAEVNFNGLDIEIQQYLPIAKKREIVEDVAMRCLVDNSGVQLIHSYLLHIPRTVAILRYYTNLTLSKDNYEAYDLISKFDLCCLLDKIPQSEIDEIDRMINKFVEDLRFNQMHSNSVETVIKEMLDKLIGKMPSLDEAKKFIEDASKEIEGFDPNKMDFVKSFMEINKGESIGNI